MYVSCFFYIVNGCDIITSQSNIQGCAALQTQCHYILYIFPFN